MMKVPLSALRRSALLLFAALLASPSAWSAPVAQALDGAGTSPMRAPPGTLVSPQAEVSFGVDAGASGAGALGALGSGRWARACSIATAVLARHVPDVDALGVFGLCAASANDGDSARRALDRLREAETTPYYEPLVRGVLNLQAKDPAQARQAFGAALQARPGDPLATYFTGEAQHAARQDEQAIDSFRSVLKRWPQFAPALNGAARLLAKPDASPGQLRAARDMAERATAIEPMNTGYWRLLAELCQRTGQSERASAITLQWLRPPAPAAAR